MNAWSLHRATMAYGQAMYLAGQFRERGDLRSHSRALEVSVVIHRRILNLLDSFTPPF